MTPSHPTRSLVTRRGTIPFPAYLPVTTFGKKYPLDDLIRPYLPRLAPAVMVSHYYAQQMKLEQRPSIPLWIDSGGFAALFEGTQILDRRGVGVLEVPNGDQVDLLHPKDVLTFQEDHADVALTLDFPIPPGLDDSENHRRQQLTITNALWALDNRRRPDLRLYACVQAWDVASAQACAQAYQGKGFDGVAIGGLVPRTKHPDQVLAIVRAVRDIIGDLPLHVLGLGNPKWLPSLYEAGADSVDSSSYVQYAANGKLWGNPNFILEDPSPTDRLHLALCNLALATGKTLPLSTAMPIFTTLQLSQKTPLNSD
ncbi:tRNA-guanine transglycosylase [Phormidium sp. FACHB-1136]|uniref:tRNA-guanine transglycosylase n=1 Tax=Phormidium sp. FACHB-1136 TaxID=2692848 RepID=UPI0016890F03|nr:tRNA-guanine transglycosylase [Phormidium sp. FACHB-1136]MBD2429346.1 tRNA-guanine transglycosylase [Phormidium sp. FACHB-1136]